MKLSVSNVTWTESVPSIAEALWAIIVESSRKKVVCKVDVHCVSVLCKYNNIYSSSTKSNFKICDGDTTTHHCCILKPVCMADPHYHGNSCQFLGWASMSKQKWGLFVQISFLAVHEKSNGRNTDAMLALQKQSSSVTHNNSRTVMTHSHSWKHLNALVLVQPAGTIMVLLTSGGHTQPTPTQSNTIQYPDNKYNLCQSFSQFN